MMGYLIPNKTPISSLSLAIRISFPAEPAPERRNRLRRATGSAGPAREHAAKNTFIIKLFYYIMI
jgi:hypothetical protein